MDKIKQAAKNGSLFYFSGSIFKLNHCTVWRNQLFKN